MQILKAKKTSENYNIDYLFLERTNKQRTNYALTQLFCICGFGGDMWKGQERHVSAEHECYSPYCSSLQAGAKRITDLEGVP